MSELIGFRFCVFLLLLSFHEVVQGAEGDLNENCKSSDSSCNSATLHVCDTNLQTHQCKIKNGTACTVGSSCVDGAACTGTPKLCVCQSWRTPVTAEGICAPKPNEGEAGGDCRAVQPCDPDLVCENAICKYKNNTACTTHTDLCVDGALCTGSTSKICVCQVGRTPAAADGKCAAKPNDGAAGGNCKTGQSCDQGLVCVNAICIAGNNGATSLLASSLLLVFGVFVTSRLS